MKPGECKLGSEAKDSISGFKGVVVCISTWLNGCERIAVQPKKLTADGKPVEVHTFDCQDIELVKPPKQTKTRKTGGDRENEKQSHSDPERRTK